MTVSQFLYNIGLRTVLSTKKKKKKKK